MLTFLNRKFVLLVFLPYTLAQHGAVKGARLNPGLKDAEANDLEIGYSKKPERLTKAMLDAQLAERDRLLAARQMLMERSRVDMGEDVSVGKQQQRALTHVGGNDDNTNAPASTHSWQDAATDDYGEVRCWCD